MNALARHESREYEYYSPSLPTAVDEAAASWIPASAGTTSWAVDDD